MSKESKTEPEKRQEQAPNIHQRLLAVISESGALAKEGKRYAGGYHQIDDVVAHLRPLLVRHGVTISPNVVNHWMDQHQDNQERVVHAAKVLLLVSFYNADNPEDMFTSSSVASGFSYEDKALAVAYSYALKNVLLAVFQLRGQPDAESGNITTAKKREQAKQDRKAELDTEEKLGPTETQLELAAEWENDPRIKKLAVPDHDNITGYDVIRKVILNGKRGNRRQVQGVLDWLAEELGVPQIQAAEKPDASPKGFQPPPQADDITDDDIPF